MLIRKLGEGGMGKVYLAVDELANNQTVAIKILKEEKYRGALKKLLTSEFKFLKTLDHENIARVFDFGFIEGTSTRFFTSEFVEGKDLYQFTKDCANDTLLDIAVQICRALNYIHSRGIVHGDIKPSNILISHDGTHVRAKIMDFGLSFTPIASDQRKPRGTPAYMAPELVLGQEIDHRIDLYALGITLYAIVYRKTPFEGSPSKGLFKAILHDKIQFDNQDRYPDPLVQIVMRLVEKQPWNRYQSANDVISEINSRLGCAYALETSETQKSYLSKTKLLERDAIQSELSSLIENIRDAKLDHSSNVLIEGAKGTGKSRLLDEIKSQAQLEGVYTIVYDCARHRSDFSLPRNLHAFLHGIEESETSPSAQFDVMENSIAEDADPETQDINLNMQKYGLFKAVSEQVMRSSLRKPILLFIDDFHLLDKASAEFLNYLLADLKSLYGKMDPQFAIVASFLHDAPSANPTSSTPLVAPIPGGIFDRTLPIGNFTSKETLAQFVRSALTMNAVPAHFVSQLYDVTQGNPLLTMEYLSLLSNAGLILFGREREISDNIDLTMLDAPSLEAIHLHQVNRLSSPEITLLKWLSCFYYGCPLDVLLDLLESDTQIEHYYRLLADRILTEAGPERAVSFVNVGLKKTLYQGLNPDDKRRYHKKILTILEEIQDLETPEHATASDESLIYECAYQSQQIGDPTKAIHYNSMAARTANRKGSLYQAIHHYEACLRHPDQLESGTYFKILWNLIHLNSFVGHYTVAIDLCNRIKKEAYENPVLVREASLKLATIYKDLGHYAASLEIIDGLELSGISAFSDFDRCRLYNLRTTCLLARSTYDRAIEFSNQCLSIVDANGNDKKFLREKMRALANIAQANSFMGAYQEAIDLLNTALDLATDRSDLMDRSQILTRMGYAYAVAGRIHESLDFYQKAYEIAQSIHSLRGQSILAINLASTYFKLGEIEKSLTYFEEARKTALKMNSLTEQAFCKVNLGNLYRLLGLEKMAEDTLTETYRLVKEKGLGSLEQVSCHYLALLFLGCGNLSKAEEWFGRISLVAESIIKERPNFYITLKLTEMKIHITKQNFEEAQTIAHSLFQFISSRNDASLLDTFLLLQGQILLNHKKDFEAAQKCFSKALESHDTLNANMPSFDNFDLLVEIHHHNALCYSEQGLREQALRHYKQCVRLISEMLKRIPEHYRKSFLAHAGRGAVMHEAEVFESEEITLTPQATEKKE